MSRAIGMRVRRAEITDDPGVSKFFGDPTVPNAWCDNWPDDVIFFCQLRLDDIAALDKEDRLPHKGYLYIFLDMNALNSTLPMEAVLSSISRPSDFAFSMASAPSRQA